MKKLFFIVNLLFLCAHLSFGVKYQLSDQLTITKLSDHTYIHTSDNHNGLIYVNNGEAIVVSTPSSNAETETLINWIQKELNSSIKAWVIDSWHPNSSRGLREVIHAGIKTYSHQLTKVISEQKGLLSPEIGFDPTIGIKVGSGKIICYYLGSAHTMDGIVAWVPEDKILFGGDIIMCDDNSGLDIADADLEEWGSTVHELQEAFPNATIVIPGEGTYGDKELINYTISLFSPSEWASILKKHNIERLPVFQEYTDYFQVAESVTTNGNNQTLNNAIVFAKDDDRYMKVESECIIHNIEKNQIDADCGRLQIFYESDNKVKPTEDIYFEKISIVKNESDSGYKIVLNGMMK